MVDGKQTEMTDGGRHWIARDVQDDEVWQVLLQNTHS